ncbi:pyrroline-5-carboxylate reductase [Methanoculleus sp. FWC-SCC3]|uniref:Pyrroline-5-carboxylate reductase n=1 Tax=Methanoculleus methanifontis TaxID=2584086 RepID=A0ABT8M521_9EURY|nr:pyrroline-5-carboxylate reductase dimerization domain-containing protein [Methanoculleus sp. FWC-SCC3]MDN7013706.1 pyrroline-5-carboxylate reductase [Methanoculleus sp. FWC-SCC3]
MNCIGVIGYGHMGSMLVNGFLSSGVLGVDEVVVTSRSQESRDACAAAWPGIGIARANREIARRCRTVILAVRPQETTEVLREIVPGMDGDEHVVSLAAGVGLTELEGLFSGSVTRAIPTITSTIGQGTTLVCHGRQVGMHDALRVEGLFSSIGNVMLVEEDELPAATILSSCGPGLLAAVIEELAGATARASGLAPDRALCLATETAAATAAYLRETGETPGDLVGRVATGGGVTEAGVKGLRERLPQVFDETVAAMLVRYGAVGK